MAGHGGGAWKVAYADFVTAMMAFFLVMWIVAQNKSVKEAVSGYFRDPFGGDDKPAGSGHAIGYVPKAKAKTDGVEKGKGAGAGPAPKFEVIRDRHGTTIGAFVLFAETSTELDAVGKERLDELVPLIRGKQNRIEVRAHTARRPVVHGETPLDDWKICYERSLAVMRYLESKGVETWRLRLGLAGPNEPAADASNELWRVRNSRVELIMMDEYFDDRERMAAESGGDAHHDAHGGHGGTLTSGHAKEADHGKGAGHGKDAAHGNDAAHGKHEADGHDAGHGKPDAHGKDSHAKPGDHVPATQRHDGPTAGGHAGDPHAARPSGTSSGTKGADHGAVGHDGPSHEGAGRGPGGHAPQPTKPAAKRPAAKGLHVPPAPSGGAH